MKETQFIEKNKQQWQQLEELSAKADKKNVTRFSPEEIKSFLYLFRHTSHCLAYARTNYPSSKSEVYLNAITAKAHNHIYAKPKKQFSSFTQYFTKGFPMAIKESKRYLLVAFAVFSIAFLFAFIAAFINQDTLIYFLPEEFLKPISLENGGNWDRELYPLLSSIVMTNNIRVSFMAFAFGLTFGIGTFYVLFYNGAMLGALTAKVLIDGAGFILYTSLIIPHGIPEIAAIIISGAGGLMLGKNLLVPGAHTRAHALVKGAKQGVRLVPGIILMLVIAGLIEGFFTPLPLIPLFKLFVAGILALLLIAYFYFLPLNTD